MPNGTLMVIVVIFAVISFAVGDAVYRWVTRSEERRWRVCSEGFVPVHVDSEASRDRPA